jgi:hypothetical protein
LDRDCRFRIRTHLSNRYQPLVLRHVAVQSAPVKPPVKFDFKFEFQIPVSVQVL